MPYPIYLVVTLWSLAEVNFVSSTFYFLHFGYEAKKCSCFWEFSCWYWTYSYEPLLIKLYGLA